VGDIGYNFIPDDLTSSHVDSTNVPDIAMAFSDKPFPYGPFVPHWVPKQYIENYFSWHRTDSCLVLNTTVEDVSRIPAKDNHHDDRWKLTLRRFNPTGHVDIWWEEEFDAVILANGHYSVPFVRILLSLFVFNSTSLSLSKVS
jgi:cation diffusion facilitator CzcD-associated flavoprotein CzcO